MIRERFRVEPRSEPRGRSRQAFRIYLAGVAGVTVVVALVLAVVLPGAARAHFADFTGDRFFYCTLSPFTGCTLTTSGGDPIFHSYGFNSAKNTQSNNRYICAWIDDGPNVPSECGWNFERLCYPPWNHSTDDLDCHDRDGTAFKAGLFNHDQFTASVQGHPNW